MLSSLAISALVILSGVSSVTGNALATINPCPGCPKSLSHDHPSITITKQYQAVSTCIPEKTCSKKKCYSTASCSTYDWVSTHVPCLGGTTTTVITKTDQILELAHVSTVLTTYLPCATPTAAPHWNGTKPAYKNETCTSAKYQTMIVDISAPYNECGPMAIPPWKGSGLCGKKCGTKPEDQKDQPVSVSKCLDGACSTYAETWISLKPTTKSSSSVIPYASSTYCSKSGVNTIPVTATYTPPAGGEFSAPCTKTFSITTSVPSPGPVEITKTITVTFTKEPEPTVSHSTSKVPLSTSIYVSNGVHTIPLVTTCSPINPHFTDKITTTVYYTTTVHGGPKTIGCTTTVTVVFTSTTTVCPQTVISGHTQSPSTAPPTVSASTTPTGVSSSYHHCPTCTIVTATSTRVTSITASSSTSTAKPTHPSQVGDCEYYGCLGSTGGFSTFSVAETSGSNSVEQCISECQAGGFLFAGLYTTDCYCASSIDAGTGGEKANGVCNLPCPGNSLETCGGNSLVSKKRTISNSILLDVYECNKGTPTSSSGSSTSEPTSDPSSDPDPAPVPRGLDADMDIAQPKPRDIKLRRGGLLRNPRVQQGPTLAKRDFGLKSPFGQ